MKQQNIIKILVSSCRGTIFLRSIDTFIKLLGTPITIDYIHGHIRQAIMDVGLINVVQVVTDNVSNCKFMGSMITKEFPHTVWNPCATHCLDIMVEDIGKLNWVKEVFDMARRLVKFVTKKLKVLAMYRIAKDFGLVKFSSIHFATMFLVLEQLVKVHKTLGQMVVSNAWFEWTNSRTQEARDFETYVFSHDFWKNAQAIVTNLQPFYIVLHLVDKEGCTIGLLYEFLNKNGETLLNVGNLFTNQFLDVRQQWLHQWEWFH